MTPPNLQALRTCDAGLPAALYRLKITVLPCPLPCVTTSKSGRRVTPTFPTWVRNRDRKGQYLVRLAAAAGKRARYVLVWGRQYADGGEWRRLLVDGAPFAYQRVIAAWTLKPT